MAFTEDLNLFFGDFGVDGSLDGLAVRVIYDAPPVTDLGVTTTQPQVQIVSASVPAAVFGKTLVIPQGSFVVREVLPDDAGLSLLLLTKT